MQTNRYRSRFGIAEPALYHFRVVDLRRWVALPEAPAGAERVLLLRTRNVSGKNRDLDFGYWADVHVR